MQFHFSRSGASAPSTRPSHPRRADSAPSSAAPAHEPGADAALAPRMIGKYLVSPLIKALDNGWFASSVSIRSGCGSATTDRILRLTRLFRCRMEAALFAHAEGLQWIRPAHA